MAGHGDDLLEEGWGFTPKCQMDDAERFKDCLPLTALCSACGEVRAVQLFMWYYYLCALVAVLQECEVKSVQLLGDATRPGKNGLTCGFCGSQYFGRQ